MTLKTSINVKYDLDNKRLIDDYFATNSHSVIIKGVLKSVITDYSSKSHIAYGPYGSGKSYVSTIIANLISKSYSKNALRKLSNKYNPIDNSFSALISKSQEINYDFIPVVLNGFSGSFESSIISTVQEELLKRDIYIATPGIFTEISKIIKRWKKDYIQAFIQFESALTDRDYTYNEFNKSLKSKDEKIVKLFTEIYEEITFGSKITYASNSKVIEYLEFVLRELNKRKIGLFIVYDEFGRVLQSIDSDNLNQFMGIMQDLAELATNGSKNLLSLFVTHKPISYYFSLESREKRSEFAKVEKRFSVYEIKSDYTTFLKITQDFLVGIEKPKVDSNMGLNMRKFNVFANELSDQEVETIVLESLYPLHPITLYLLPNISKVFGQNERTLFTFLKDESSSGLTGFFSYDNGYYYPDMLADYFFDNIDESYIDNVKTYHIYRKNIDDIRSLTSSSTTVDSLRIFKFIMLWSISGSNSVVQLSDEFISFSLGIDLKRTIKLLDKLAAVKKIRFNVIISEWEIFEGSPVDVNLEVQNRLAMLSIDDNTLVNYISSTNPNRYIYSKQFNTEFEMTRFGIVEYIISSSQIEGKRKHLLCDQLIPVFIGLEAVPSNYDKEIYGVMDFDIQKLYEVTKKLIALSQLLKDTNYIKENPNVDKEIEYEITLIEIELDKFYKRLFSKDVQYFVYGESKKIRSLDRFESILSDLLIKKYSQTIHIVNDQINMFELTKIQTNALITVLDKVIHLSSDELDDYFVGSKPTDLIYYTVIRDLKEINGNAKKLKIVKDVLVKHINDYPDDLLSSLVSVLQDEPFGLRPQISLLLTFVLIKDLWKDMMLFSNGSFIPSIDTDDLFYAILNDSDRIRYSFNVFDNKNREYLEKLETVFDNIPYEVENKSLSIRVCAGMYNWYLNLPIITQQLEGLDISNIEFMKIISGSRINPRNAITELLNNRFIDDIEYFVQAVELNLGNKLESIERKIKSRLQATSLIDWAISQDEISKKNNKFVSLCINSKNIIEDYARYVENVGIERWTKSSFEKMELMIEEDINLLKEDVDFSSIVVNGKEKLVQNVSLSRKTENALDNIVNTIDATRRYYSDAELEQLIIELVKKYIK